MNFIFTKLMIMNKAFIARIQTFNQTKSGLQNKKANYHTYTPPGDKIKTLILKGLDGSDNEKHILQSLKEINLEKVEIMKVSRLKTKLSIENNINLPIYIYI